MVELSHEASQLLNASRIAEPPSPESRHRIRAGIAAATGAAVVAGATGSATAAIAGSAGTSKVVIAAVVAGALGFGSGALVVHAIDKRAATPTVAVAPAPRAPEIATAPEVAAPLPRVETASADVPATSMHLEPAASVAPPEPPPVAPPAAEPAPVEGPGLAAELSLIRAADDALAMHYPGRALALVDNHAARFPDGQLAQERDSLRVLTLCELGRDDDARTAARAFFAHWPGSPHGARLRASCAVDSSMESTTAGHSH